MDQNESKGMSLKKRVEAIVPNDLNDITTVRDAMKIFGDYKGLFQGHFRKEFMDLDLENSIRGYQKKKGLTVDGFLDPEGETEQAVNKDFELVKHLPPLFRAPFDVAELRGHYKRLKAAPIDDGEKHRELACRAGQKGDLGAVGILAAGWDKERRDYLYKTKNPEEHGGKEAIYADCIKDTGNNIKGAWYGYKNALLNRNVDCEKWSKKK